MVRESYLNTEERRRPYWVRLGRIDGKANHQVDQAPPSLQYLDLRGLEFSRPTTARLDFLFHRLARGFNIRRHETEDYCLMITPLAWTEDLEIVGEHIEYTKDTRDDLRKRSFQWHPVPDDERELATAWRS